MTTDAAQAGRPLWLAMEGKIGELGSAELDPGAKEQTVQQVATALDGMGYNVSRHAGNMLDLRAAIDARIAVGRPLSADFEQAIAALTLEDVADPLMAAIGVATRVGEDWPRLKKAARRTDIVRVVETTKLELLVANAKKMEGERGIRYLIAEDVASEDILAGLGISQEELDTVHAAIAEEQAAIERVEKLLGKVEDQSDEDRAKHLINNDVPDELITQVAGLGQGVIDAAKQAMEAELAERKRLEEEAAARRQAEAEGPALEAIPADELADYIEEIREIMEFSDEESEIRSMCETSSIPKCLVDIAVSNPDKLDELEG